MHPKAYSATNVAYILASYKPKPTTNYHENLTVDYVSQQWINATLICAMSPVVGHQLDKMVAMPQPILTNAFHRMTKNVFWFKFHRRLFLRAQLTISQCWYCFRLGTEEATSHCLNRYWPIHRRIYVALGGDELKADMICISCILLFLIHWCATPRMHVRPKQLFAVWCQCYMWIPWRKQYVISNLQLLHLG